MYKLRLSVRIVLTAFLCFAFTVDSHSQTTTTEETHQPAAGNSAPGEPSAARKGVGGKKRGGKKRALQAQNGVVAAPSAPAEPAAAAAPAAPAIPAGTSPLPSMDASAATSKPAETLPPAEQTGEGDVEQTARPRRGKRPKKISSEPPTPLPQVNAVKLTANEDYDTQPSVTELPNGETYLAWVRYTPEKKDEIVAMLVRGGQPRQRLVNWKVISGTPGQFIRPVINAAGQDLYCFWTSTDEQQLASIYYAKMTNSQWSEAQRLLPKEGAAHQNPEVAATKDGKLAIAYQVSRAGKYAIEVRQLANGQFSEPISLGNPAMDQWDPAAAYDTSGNLHVTWSAFDSGDYDVYVATIPTGSTTSSTPKRISARGTYDMHPWLASAPDGKMWISWDSVQIGQHGYSGRTTITGANLRDNETSGTGPEHGDRAKWSGIEVRVLDGETVRIPGNPREEITAPEGYKFAHRALGKISVGSDGGPWVLYRMLVQTNPAWAPNSNAGYYWELHARAFRDGKWQAPVSLLDSDGYLEEPGVYASSEGVRVAYTSEHRRTQTSNVSYETRKETTSTPTAEPGPAAIEENYNHHHDFDNFLGWDGDIYLATLGTAEAGTPAPNIASLTTEDKPADKAVDERLTRERGRHEVRQNDQVFNLYWGDTHRHSNVSRCSVGTEPTPDDLYRYGIDINLYDFFALSDHAEHTTDYYWWKQQKTADLYNIPGLMSVLYNYEWSMNFPHGHHNAIFATRSNYKMNGKTGAASTMRGGWDLLAAGGYKAITAPHTTADPGMGTNWNAHDDRYQRVCEIFQSCRGSYEHDGCPRQHANAKNKAGFYWKGLEKGYKMGIICSSDHGYGCAYACTYATTNTREAVWQSIWDRRCYGSTTYGLVADVRSGNHWMGEEWTSADAPPLSIYVRGSAPIRSVEIMGRSKVLHAAGSTEKPLNTIEFRLDWTDPEWASLSGEQWYYVRIIQTDDEMAWTSPMWVKKQ